VARIAKKYATLDPSGGVMRCGPLPEERIRGRLGASASKDVYPDAESAWKAAAELEAAGSDPLRPYQCRRSRKRPHYHLSGSTYSSRRATG
jgi:hypothetical protein